MSNASEKIIAVRIHAGFNAGVFLGGLLALTDQTGGMAGAYLATTGHPGRATLHCRMEGALPTEASVIIRRREA